MTEGDIGAAKAMWREQGGAPDLPWDQIERALRRLPDAGICAVSDDGTALFMLTPTDTVFTVSVEDGKVRLTSRRLEADRLAVSLEWDENSSRWSFSYTGEPGRSERWQRISGSVTTDAQDGREEPDDREQFARALAARAGWAHGIHRPSETEAGSAPAGEKAAGDEPRWRARTDVWGRPLDVGRH